MISEKDILLNSKFLELTSQSIVIGPGNIMSTICRFVI